MSWFDTPNKLSALAAVTKIPVSTEKHVTGQQVADFVRGSTVVDLTTLGIVADDTGAEAANDAILEQMRLDVEASGVSSVTIIMPKNGIMHFTKNLWIPYGTYCRDVLLLGENSFVQCNNVSNPSGNDGGGGAWAWGIADHYTPYPHQHISGNRLPHYGYRFNSVVSGSRVIPFTNTAELSNFSVGNRVWLNGKNKQNLGYPPNCEFHEYGIVESKDATSITLKEKIRYTYDDTWHDQAPSYDVGVESRTFGKPRIINLDDITKASCFDSFRVIDVHHLGSAHAGADPVSTQYFALQGALFAEAINCTSVGTFSVSHVKDAYIRNCPSALTNDIDKGIGNLLIEGSFNPSGTNPATGAEAVTYQHSKCYSTIRFASRLFNINEVDVLQASAYGGVTIETSAIQLGGKVNDVRVHIDGDLVQPLQIPTDRTITPDSAAAYHFYTNTTVSSINQNVVNLYDGSVLSDKDQINWARVKKVMHDNGNNRHDVEHTYNGTLTAPVIVWPGGEFDFSGIKVIAPNRRHYEDQQWRIPFMQHMHPGKKARFEGLAEIFRPYPTTNNRTSMKYVGRIRRMRFVLLRAAKAATANHLYELNISDRGDVYFSPTVNIKKVFSGESATAGSWVEIDFVAGTIMHSGWSGTTGTPANLTGISRTCTFLFLDVTKPTLEGGGSLSFANDLDAPRFIIEIDGEPMV